MLIVDGSATPNSVIWRQTVSVRTNTTYIFSAWDLRFDSDTPPPATLYFAINGSQQGPLFVLPGSPGGWQWHGTTWNSGISTVATLELRDRNGQGGPGNNLALDDVTFVKSSDVPPPAVGIAVVNNVVQLDWLSYPGLSYQLQSAASLSANTWLDLGLPVMGYGITNYMTDQILATQRFYRVVQFN